MSLAIYLLKTGKVLECVRLEESGLESYLSSLDRKSLLSYVFAFANDKSLGFTSTTAENLAQPTLYKKRYVDVERLSVDCLCSGWAVFNGVYLIYLLSH